MSGCSFGLLRVSSKGLPRSRKNCENSKRKIGLGGEYSARFDRSLPYDLFEGTDAWTTSWETCSVVFVLFNMARGFQNICESISD